MTLCLGYTTDQSASSVFFLNSHSKVCDADLRSVRYGVERRLCKLSTHLAVAQKHHPLSAVCLDLELYAHLPSSRQVSVPPQCSEGGWTTQTNEYVTMCGERLGSNKCAFAVSDW